MKIKRKILPILVGILFFGCSTKEIEPPKAVHFTMLSPSLKISDAGFVRFKPNWTELQIYSSGVSLLEVSIKDRICYNGACKDELEFNKEFFKRAQYRGFFSDILKKKPIFNAQSLVKTPCGFDQNLTNITYQVCNNVMRYNDSKEKIKIIIKELN
ncbi:MAG: hypothetical protein GX282_00060 [Campylobacteraceae bacterium]|nr:hypothetical protein [Campylobacteraceae bacterium]